MDVCHVMLLGYFIISGQLVETKVMEMWVQEIRHASS
jgi:hypothetical protein